ncbi:MAG: hypothetical protein FWD71_17445, partial [Oscillospiraceae bacterium]|nr:hypothetical protein [Oscillospiraceae bacterium]
MCPETPIYVGADGNPPVILRDDYHRPLQFPDRSNVFVLKLAPIFEVDRTYHSRKFETFFVFNSKIHFCYSSYN